MLFSRRQMSALGGRGGRHGAGYQYSVVVGFCRVLGAHGLDSGHPTGAGEHRLGWGCPVHRTVCHPDSCQLAGTGAGLIGFQLASRGGERLRVTPCP